MGLFGTKASLFSDISLILEFLVTAFFIVGIRYAGKVKRKHCMLMATAFTLDVSFMVSYMIKSLIEGRTEFVGPETIKLYVYLPTVIIHSIISLLVLFMAAYMVFSGFRGWTERHRKLGMLTFYTWLISFASGIAVYLLLYVLFI
jgi:putative membrane protein